jgi:hypothetical protein
VGVLAQLVNSASLLRSAAHRRRRVQLPLGPGVPPMFVRRADVDTLRLVVAPGDREPTLHVSGVQRGVASGGRRAGSERPVTHDFHGDEAIRVAARVLPLVNEQGASRRIVADAVDLLEIARTPGECFALIAEAHRRRLAERTWQLRDGGNVQSLPAAARLALEMAAHEDSEHRALEGELGELARAWRDAEALAAIADGLALPAEVDESFERLKRRASAGDGT